MLVFQFHHEYFLAKVIFFIRKCALFKGSGIRNFKWKVLANVSENFLCLARKGQGITLGTAIADQSYN